MTGAFVAFLFPKRTPIELPRCRKARETLIFLAADRL
jgi:hypothetical protein